MLGAVIRDIIGSVYEWHNVKSLKFELFSNESRFTDGGISIQVTNDGIIVI
jgi:hypothetical protein